MEQTGITKAASYLSQCTTLYAGESCDGDVNLASETRSSLPERSSTKPDPENCVEVEPLEAISIWTRQTIGIAFGGFLLAFLSATVTGVAYGFFLGYMGLDSYVLSSITALMKLPEVLLLPFGFLTDCCPIRGQNRKPYMLLCLGISACALLAMILRPLPDPYYCQHADGRYNWYVPPCNPDIRADKNWYVFPLFILTAGGHLSKYMRASSLKGYEFLSP